MYTTFKVKISCLGQAVTFEASPTLVENRTASWTNYDLVHLPTTIWAYKNTTHRRFSIQGRLVSRTAEEAMKNSEYLNLIRSWVLPDFGDSGATPPIVTLTAYENSNIDNLKCIISSYSWTFNQETDYIYTGGDPMPIIGDLSVDLDEIYSPQEITAVDPWKIKDRQGNVVGNTPPLFALLDSFSGLASSNSLAASMNALASSAAQSGSSIANNALSGAIQNSPAISESLAAVSAIQSNRNLTSLLPGETAGVPNNQVAAVTQQGDNFGRITRTVIGPIFG